jgi:hypothetical protein
MNRDHGCTSCPSVAFRPRRSSDTSDFSTMEPDLFDFCSLNSRCREDGGGASRDAGTSSSHSSQHALQRLPMPRRSYSDDMLQPRAAHSRPSRVRGGPKKSRRFIPPFKMMGSRGGSMQGEVIIGSSDHAIASVSSDSRTTLSSKSRQSHAPRGNDDRTSAADLMKAHADAVLPFESFAMTLSDGENDCISEVSVDDDNVEANDNRAQALHPASNHRPLPSSAIASNSLSARPHSYQASAAPPNPLAFAEDVAPPNRAHRVLAETGAGACAAPDITAGSSFCSGPAMMVEVVSGSFVPLIGTRDTLDAYRTGSVVDQACLGCNEFLLCSDRATLVICPVCRSISPVVAVAAGRSSGVQMESNLGGRGGLLGLGLTVHMIESEILGLP